MQSDNHLIRKIKKKQNKEAAGLLIERYYREIYAYTYRQVACKELAMDLTQEIFILVLKGIRAFDEKKGSFRTWIYRIASNKIITEVLHTGRVSWKDPMGRNMNIPE